MENTEIINSILQQVEKEQILSSVTVGNKICLFDRKGNQVSLLDPTKCTLTAFIKQLGEDLSNNLI